MKTKFLRVAWILGCWLVAFSAGAGINTALHFNGTNNYAAIPHNAALNGYPMTVTAWFRCVAANSAGQVILSKYTNSSYDGWALVVAPSGQLRGFYYRGGNAGANMAIDSYAGNLVTDGLWHQAALAVDANGGRLYLDGNLLVSNAWKGVAGAITNTQPVVFSGLNDGSLPLAGDLDEITLWNRGLTANEINYLKHRQLRGNEDGLLGNWKCNDGAGPIAADSTANHFNAALVNGPVWIASQSPVVLNMMPTNCVKFSGSGGIVTITNAPDLNPYPFTVTTWFRSTVNSSAVQVIAAKYTDVSYDGWALAVQNGQLRGFLYRAGSVGNRAIDAYSGTFVADGGWHQGALVVDTTGGRLYLDGSLVASNNWTGTAGPITSTAAITLGELVNGYPITADVDEVTLWSRALATSEITSQMNLPLVGNEPNLVGYWKLDEGTGTSTADSTGNGHTGALSGPIAWTGSTAYLGDGTTHLIASLDQVVWKRTFAIAGSPGQSAFAQAAIASLSRIYDYGSAPTAETVSGTLDYTLQTSTGTAIPLNQSEVAFSSSLGSQLAAAPRTNSTANGWYNTTQLVASQPAGVQLNSVDYLYQTSITLAHVENGGANVLDATNTSPATRLFHFDGNLYCGPSLILFSNLDVNPVASNIVAGVKLDCPLNVSVNAGYIPGTADTFGDGTALAVSLATNGDCTLKSGIILLTSPPNDVDTIQNISFRREVAGLNTNGAIGQLTLYLPTGFGRGISNAPCRLLTNTLPMVARLDNLLRPLNNLTSPPSVTLYFNAETLPCWINTTQFVWRVNDGQLAITPLPTTGVQFVRQFEDNTLTANQASLADTNLANRISNDAYFRNAQPYAASPELVVTADANGCAQVNGSLTLQPPDLRPHFPYTDTQPGSQVPVSAGVLTLQNNLVDASSYLALTSAVPLAYSQDCTDTNCSGATAGLASVQLAPPAYQLSFTPDGGLLGFGPVATPLTPGGVGLAWGFNSSGVYAQQTSLVGNGVYEMAGTFLRGDQTALANSQRAAAMLFTGWGNDTDGNLMERPGTPDYANGFANYAGINLRQPVQGRSTIASLDTGWYPLTARAKYYARNGGVSGIHEAASFPSTFPVYGYNFTFTNYLLSYLDSENWESRTIGGITFPAQPAGFTIGFDHLKFVCSGGLDSAQLPANTGSKHLNYWNADFTPQSVQFKPAANEQCSTAPRTLVLGAELQLPLVTEAMHALLGFKTNGNLSTITDNLQGTDSRFILPATLSLQGSSGNVYPVAIASKGYFNNWDNTQRPEQGFFTFAGKIRVPFFQAIKAQLQVSPPGTATPSPTVAIAGGWPLASAPNATDFGWAVNGSNYFNNAQFDPSAYGWPQNVTLNGYLSSSTEQYHARAQCVWKNLAFFDYPVTWDPLLRRFEGFNSGTLSLPVLDVGSHLKLLSASKVDFDFNQDLNLGLPHIKALDFINETIDGPFNSISNAIFKELKGTADATGISSGLRSLQGVLNSDVHGFFDPILGPAFNGLAGNIVSSLQTNVTSDPATVIAKVDTTMATFNSQFQSAVAGINGTAGQANTVLGQLNTVYTNVDDSIGLLLQIVETDTNGNRHIVRAIVEQLVKDQSKELGQIFTSQGGNLDGAVNNVLADYESDLASIESDLQNLRSQMGEVHAQIVSATGPIIDGLNAITNDIGAVQQFEQMSTAGISNLLSGALTSSGDYFTANPAAAQADIRHRLEDAFINSALTGDYQTKFRQFVSDDDFLLNQLLCLLTDKINRAVRSSIESYISGGSDNIYTAMNGVGQMQKNLLTAKLRGQPTFNGDTLEMIHLDADMEFHLPDAMHYNAFIEIRSMDSQSGALACEQGGSSAAEIIVGANRVPLQWPGVQSSGITLTINGRWTLNNGAVTGVGGLLELDGKADFSGFSLRKLGATFAFGDNDNYFAGKASAVVLIGPVPVELNAGIFGGHSCSMDPLLYVDTNAPAILGNISNFSGVYAEFGGGVSLSDLLFGASSCLLNIDAQVSYTEFFLGGTSSLNLGYYQNTDIDLSLLCVLSGSIKSTVGGTATKDANGFHLELIDSTQACGSIGPCPFCVEGCKTITLKGTLKTTGIDYHLDY